MKGPCQFTAAFLVVAGICAWCACQSPRSEEVQPNLAALRLKFIPESGLSIVELDQVLALASESGIKEPAKVETFYYLPGSSRGISVTSRERIEGRNISFDTAIINRAGWTQFQPKPEVRRVGDFWFNASDKYSTTQRTYKRNGRTVRVTLGGGVDAAFADKVIALIAAKKVRFKEGRGYGSSYEVSSGLIPRAIMTGDSPNDFYLAYGEISITRFHFRLERDHVFITSLSMIQI